MDSTVAESLVQIPDLKLPSVNGNLTKRSMRIINPKAGFNPDIMNATKTAPTSRFADGGQYQFDFKTTATQTCDLSKLFWEVTDVLTNGENDRTSAACVACRSWNHIAAMFQEISVEWHNSQMERVSYIAEVDSLSKKLKYGQSWFDHFGVVQNCQPLDKRNAASDAYKTHSYLWHPDCLATSDHVVPQNCEVIIKLVPHSSYVKRCVESAVDPGITAATFKYGVTNIQMYIQIDEGVISTADSVKRFDLRPFTAASSPWNSETGTHIYTVPATTYELCLALTSATKNSSNAHSPTEFKGVAGFLEQYEIKYASQSFPNYQTNHSIVANNSIKGFAKSYYESLLSYSSDDAGCISYNEWYDSPFYVFRCIKREDDLSVSAELFLTNSAGLANAEVMVFSRHSKVMIVYYDEVGQIRTVDAQNI
jgi:hypothetical protein